MPEWKRLVILVICLFTFYVFASYYSYKSNPCYSKNPPACHEELIVVPGTAFKMKVPDKDQ